MLGSLDLRQRAELVRRFTEDGAEKPDEVMRCKPRTPGDFVHRRPRLFLPSQPIAGETKAMQDFGVQHGFGNK